MSFFFNTTPSFIDLLLWDSVVRLGQTEEIRQKFGAKHHGASKVHLKFKWSMGGV